MSAPPAGRAAALGLVLAMALWGATFVVLRDVLVRVTPAALVFIRFAAAGALLAAILAARRRGPDRGAFLGGALTGALTGAGYLFQAIGLRTASAGSSAFLTFAGTVFAALFAWPLLGQRPGRAVAIGFVVATAGAALMSLHDGLRFGVGEAWTLLGSVAFALQVVAIARWAPHVDAVALACVQSITVALLVAPFAGHPGSAWPRLSPGDPARLVYLVLFGTVVAPLLQIHGQRTLPVGRVGLLFALEPVFALVFALTLGGERFVPRWWLGAALILAAVVGVEWRAARAPGPRATA